MSFLLSTHVHGFMIYSLSSANYSQGMGNSKTLKQQKSNESDTVA